MSAMLSALPQTPEENALLGELHRILDGALLTPFFMPLVDTREEAILGYEALIRGPAGSPLHTPDKLFPAALRAGCLLKLELLCREVSIRRFKEMRLPGRLFLNVTPNSLLEPDFHSGETQALMAGFDLRPDELVLEITEQLPISDYELMRKATHHYQQQGFEVALDDLGAGYSGLRSWSELRPGFVKIDRHFIDGIDQAPVKQELVRSILEVARSIGCRVIAEGVEREEESRYLDRIHLHLQQGFYFAAPRPLPARSLPSRKRSPVRSEPEAGLLSSITRRRPGIRKHKTLADAGRRFRKDPDLLSLAVLEDGLPIGLLHRDTCLTFFLNPYARELSERKAISGYLDPQPLILEEHLDLKAISERLNRLDPQMAHSDFIITRQGRYLGMGSILDLLRGVTELKLRDARHANPLTLLPGAVPANEEIDRRLASATPLVMAYLDLDHFKAFNDAYGYQRGDEMIQLLARCMREACPGNQDQNLAAHIGGDDFLILFASSDWRARLESIQARFAQESLSCYSAADQARGALTSRDREGTPCVRPLVSLSIGVALPDKARCKSHHEVAALASDAKKLAKAQPGHSLVINRRQGPEPAYPEGEQEAAASSKGQDVARELR